MRPVCGQCRRTGTECQPHERVERSAVYADAGNVDRVDTNIELGAEFSCSVANPGPDPGTGNQSFVDTSMDSFTAEIGVLSLNAIGDMRFQGSLTGIVFCKLVTAAARKLLDVDIKTAGTVYQTRDTSPIHETPGATTSASEEMDLEYIPPRAIGNILLQAYIDWIHVVYPIFHMVDLNTLMDVVYSETESVSSTQSAMFNLIMALGAIHQRDFDDKTYRLLV